MKERIVIWGVGNIGKLAFYYYQEKGEIVCFIDSNSNLWGEKMFGVPIYSPNYLEYMNNIKIVLAVHQKKEMIQEQLLKQYHIEQCITFDVMEEVIELYHDDGTKKQDEIIIEYEGGLGNQMFQYAFGRCFQKRGCKVTADISTYYHVGRREFVLKRVFCDVRCRAADIALKWKYKKESLLFVEKSIYEEDKKMADLTFLHCTKGYFSGYWQSETFAAMVEKELREEFRFPEKKEEKLIAIVEQIESQCAVSVHVRRGDYLNRKSQEIMGGICTMAYYRKAIKYMMEYFPRIVFYFFSEDVEWCRENFSDIPAVFVDRRLFDFYEDWYDMYLMSCCKHNIIANSTFSWWGAWLNSTSDKVVIAPKKWVNVCDLIDICPYNWIRM